MPKTGSKLVPNRIFDAETLRTPLERLLELSRKPQEPKKRSWERLWSGLGPKRGAKMGAEIESQNAPRCFQEAKTVQEGSKKPLGTDFKPPGSPQALKNNNFANEMSMLRRSPRGLPGARYKTSKSISRYSKTSLLCQEFSKIFQDKPPRASLLERKPRSLQKRIPRRARASLEGVGGGATPQASSIKSTAPRCLQDPFWSHFGTISDSILDLI